MSHTKPFFVYNSSKNNYLCDKFRIGFVCHILCENLPIRIMMQHDSLHFSIAIQDLLAYIYMQTEICLNRQVVNGEWCIADTLLATRDVGKLQPSSTQLLAYILLIVVLKETDRCISVVGSSYPDLGKIFSSSAECYYSVRISM